MLEGSNLSNRFPTKLRRSKPSFSNLFNPSPLDLTISNETMIIVATAKEDEEATKATLATMVETTAVATIPVARAKTTKIGATVDIPTTRISPVSCMEGTQYRRVHHTQETGSRTAVVIWQKSAKPATKHVRRLPAQLQQLPGVHCQRHSPI